MVSSFAPPALKFVLHMLSLIWMMVLRWVVISLYAEHAKKLVAHWMSMHKNWLLVGWACTKIGYSLAEHAQKLVTLWLSMRTNWLLADWAYAKILSEHHMHFQSSSVPHVIFSSVPFYHPCLCPMPHVSALSHILSPLSYVSVPNCLPSSVPCLTSLFLVSRPPYSVSRDMFPVSQPPFSVLKPLSTVPVTPFL